MGAKYDLIINRLREDRAGTGMWAVFIITQEGRAFVERIFGRGGIEYLDQHGVEAKFLNEHTGAGFYQDTLLSDLSVVYNGDKMAYYPALLMARVETNIEKAHQTDLAVIAHYEPLILAARGRDDRRELERLRHEIPICFARDQLSALFSI